jgi:hypothetical protein
MTVGESSLSLVRQLGVTMGLVVALVLAPSQSKGRVDAIDIGVLLDVFGCQMPLPRGFVINTKERGVTSLYSKNLSDLARVVVEPYPVSGMQDLYRTIDSTNLGPFRVLRLRVKTPSGKGDLVDRLTMITDENVAVLVYAAGEAMEGMMIDGCLSTATTDRD